MVEQSEAAKKVGESEIAVAHSGPAILTNRFFVTIGQHGLRIAFTEQYSPEQPPAFRTAVVMSIQDGIALHRLLRELLKEAEDKIEKSKAEANRLTNA